MRSEVMVLDDISARLLNQLQEEIPLVRRPFAAIGDKLGLSESDVVARIDALRAKPHGVIRQISAIFDSASLGYRSCLVAARIDESHLEAAVAVLNAHPGVSHNYLRNHDYNVWYTVAVPPTSSLGLEKTVDLLHRLSGARATRMMPTLKLYKIGVKFDVTGQHESTARASAGSAPSAPVAAAADSSDAEGIPTTAKPPELTAADHQAIRVLQQDLPAVPAPFDAWAEQAGLPLDQLLDLAKGYKQRGQMRRFAAVLRHRQAGFGANAMGVWAVPAAQQESFGVIAASFASVSHCYLRPTYPDWPYSLFTMVHGQSPADCNAVLAAISAATGIKDYSALYSSREFKKVRVRYFTGDVEEWEQKMEKHNS